MLTMREHTEKPDADISFAYVADAGDNTANSLLVAGAMLGMDVRIVARPSLGSSEDVLKAAMAAADSTGARITSTSDIAEGVFGVDVVYADIWVDG